MPTKANPAEKERGKRLEAWLAAIRPELPKTKRGMDVFSVSRSTARNWIQGADISNDAIVRILEIGGCEVLTWVLGASPAIRVGRTQVAKAIKILESSTK